MPNLEEEFAKAKAAVLEIADSGTLHGIEDRGLVCISRSLFDRLMADSHALQQLNRLAETALQSDDWMSAIENFHTDGGAIDG